MQFNKEANLIETPDFNTEALNIMLETKVIKDLNNVNKKLKLDMKTVLIILGLVVAAIYFLNGGKIV